MNKKMRQEGNATVEQVMEKLEKLEERLMRLEGLQGVDLPKEPKQEPKMEPDLEIMVTDVLRKAGVPAHIKGYAYVRSAIMLCVENPIYLDFVTKNLYPDIGKKFKTTSSRVERAIRHGIEVAWQRGNLLFLEEVFGYTIDNDKGKPTNSQFIAMLADKIRLDMKHQS